MPINIISKIKPKNDGLFPTFEDRDIFGGYQVRSNSTDRNNIPALNRKEGMLVYTQDDDKYYTLNGGLTDGYWTEVVFGGGGGSDFTLVHTGISYQIVDTTNQFISVESFLGFALTITLPLNPANGQEVIVKDTDGVCSSFSEISIEIYGNGHDIIIPFEYRYLWNAYECIHIKYNSTLDLWGLVSDWYPIIQS